MPLPKVQLFEEIQRSPKLSELVETNLSEAIEKNVFAHGDFLPSENELTQIFNVSRSVIREAMQMLSAKGLVDIQKGKGAIVKKPSIGHVFDPFSRLVHHQCGQNSLKHIVEIRKMLEPGIAALSASQRSREDLKKIEAALNQLKQSEEDHEAVSRWDIEFHFCVARSCKNPVIPIVIEPLYHVLATFHPSIFKDPAVFENTVQYHDRIYQAIAAGNSDEAELAMKSHLDFAEKHRLLLNSIA